jgi:hypothetical protein
MNQKHPTHTHLMAQVGELYVVEYSPSQKQIHIQKLGAAVVSNFKRFSKELVHSPMNAWVIIGVALDAEMAGLIADQFRKAQRGEDDGSPR